MLLRTESLPLIPHARSLIVCDVVIGVICSIAVGLMHRAGRWNLLLIAAAAISVSATPATWVALIRVGTSRRRNDSVLAFFINVVAITFFYPLLWHDDLLETIPYDLPWAAAVTFAFIAWGRIRGDRELLARWKQEAMSAQHERDALERELASSRETSST